MHCVGSPFGPRYQRPNPSDKGVPLTTNANEGRRTAVNQVGVGLLSFAEKTAGGGMVFAQLCAAMAVLIVGSVALDSIKTQTEEHPDLLGGSASYAAVSASFFQPVDLVGIVGSDFPEHHLDLFRERQIDLTGLQIVEGKTFRWAGE